MHKAERASGQKPGIRRSRIISLWLLGFCLSFACTGFAFTNTFFNLPGCAFSSAAWGDYDRDGRLDLLITGDTNMNSSEITELWRNTGSGFTKVDTGLPGIRNGCAIWGDYDNDGRLDILLAGQSHSAFIAQLWRNTGNGFSNVNVNLPGLDNYAAAWGDYDNDGRPDLLLSGYHIGTALPLTGIWRNTSTGFSNISADLPQVNKSAAAWGDFDGDGRLDLLLCGRTLTNALTQVLRNTGNGFVKLDVELPGVSEGSVAWGDFDNDGRLDILLAGYDKSNYLTQVWRNTGSAFTNIEASLTGVRWGRASWGDYDNDGRLDILLNGWSGATSVLNLFQNLTTVFIGSEIIYPAIYYGSSAWGDWNRDGRLDIVLTGYTGSEAGHVCTQVWGNSTPRANTPPLPPGALAAVVGESAVTLNWAQAADAETPGPGLTYNVRVGTSPGAGDVVSSQSLSNGVRLLPQRGNADARLFYNVNNLSPGVYYWSVQSIDTGFSGSTFANERTFVIGGTVLKIRKIPPAAVALEGYGRPATVYALEGSTNLAAWSNVTTLTADANGMLAFTNNMGPRFRFYRLSRSEAR